MRQHLQLQAQHEGFYFIADYHALTSNPSPEDLAKRTLDVAMDYLALGLDPEKTVFWRQSDVPEVTELTWLLSCVTPMGLLQRCVSYKDKVAQGLTPNHGLFAYPVLQAADILIFQSHLVPVGADSEAAHRGDPGHRPAVQQGLRRDLHPPGGLHPRIGGGRARVDGRKMSKSYGNTIEIFEPEKSVRARS